MEEALGQDRVDTTFKLNVKGTTNFGASLALIGRITSEAGPGTGQSLLHVQCKVIPFTEHLNFHMVAIAGGTVELFDVQGHLRDEYCRLSKGIVT